MKSTQLNDTNPSIVDVIHFILIRFDKEYKDKIKDVITFS